MKHILKKISILTALVLAAFCMLTACASEEDGREYGDDETIEYTWLMPSQQSLSLNQTKIIQKIKSQFNVDFTFTTAPTGQLFDQKKQLALSGADEYDIVSWITRDEANLYGGDNVFKEIRSYFTESLMPNLSKIVSDNPADVKNLYSADGKMYRLPDVNVDPASSNLEFAILQSELDAAGKTVSDMKTMQGFYDTLLAVKNLRTGTERENYYPLSIRGNMLGIEVVLYPFVMAFANGQAGYYNVTDPGFDAAANKFVNTFNTQGFADALNFVKKLLGDKLLDPAFTDSSNQGTIVENLKTGKTACVYDYNGGFSGSLSAQQDIADANRDKPNAEAYRLVPFNLPLGPGSSFVGMKANAIGSNGTVLSSKMSDSKTKRILKVIDWLYSEEAYEFLYWHPDVTETVGGVKQYKNDNMYKGVSSTVDVYLPWSISSTFQVDYYTVLKPDNAYAIFRRENVLDPANDSNYLTYPALAFDLDQLEILNTKRGAVKYFFQTNISKVIKKGELSVEDFVGQLNAKGMADIVKIYNDAYSLDLKV